MRNQSIPYMLGSGSRRWLLSPLDCGAQHTLGSANWYCFAPSDRSGRGFPLCPAQGVSLMGLARARPCDTVEERFLQAISSWLMLISAWVSFSLICNRTGNLRLAGLDAHVGRFGDPFLYLILLRVHACATGSRLAKRVHRGESRMRSGR